MRDAEEFSELLRRYFSPVGRLSTAQVQQLQGHYRLLVRWNKVLNLTSVRDLEGVVVRHYCESLFCGLHLPPEAVWVLDVGSGAGFPGIPMAVERPDCRFTLAESHQRKAVFLREATRELGNVRVEARRVEGMAEHFDWVVARAVKWEGVLSAICRLGQWVALLVGEAEAERLAARRGVEWRAPIRLPWGERRVLLIGEVRST
jgi:16S rRNA (guanine527-N7)-methyltransferase